MSRTPLHRCAAPHCQRSISTQLLMCPPHWRMVPNAIQMRVYATWRARQAGKAGAIELHEAAKTAAIESLEDA